jgi:hypothetical protein
MKTVLKWLGILLLVIVVAVVALLTYVKTALPDVGEAEAITLDYTAERIERGRYLANSVMVCIDCHSTRDWTKFSGPIKEGTFGVGGERFDQSVGMPGVYYSKNITPFGISDYTDGELFRVITTGVNKEGKAMFPLMPYPYYGRMDNEDIYSVIAYIRSLPSLESIDEESVSDFPMNFIINTIPKKQVHETLPSKNDVAAYGAYMVNASGCIECHTPVKQGQIIPEQAYSGGREFRFPDGTTVRSSNITPDMETGLGKWTEEQFIQRFKIYADTSITLPDTKPGDFNTIMPWTMYAQMDTTDLSAIYNYLRSVKPVVNEIEKFTPAK